MSLAAARPAVVAVAVMLCASLTSCSSDAKNSATATATATTTTATATKKSSAAADVTTCAAAAKAAPKPYGTGFPQAWPFPGRTVVFHVQDLGAGGTVVTGVSSTPFKTFLAFMNHDVVDAGYRIEQGETEKRDAEAEWKGAGFHGRWSIRASSTCPGETVVQVLSAAG